MRTENKFTNEKYGWITAAAGLAIAGAVLHRELTKFKFGGKVVLITGGSRGLGLALAERLQSKGARIAICARNEEQLGKARTRLSSAGKDILCLPVDVTDKAQVVGLVENVVSHFGRIDVLINNAGTIHVGPQDSMALKDFEDAMDTNFWAALYGMYSVLPHFFRQGGGKIVNITSIGGKIAVPHLLPYTASKFALVGLSEGMHAELKKHNVTVTTVVPNLMRTGSPRNANIKGDQPKEYAWFKTADASPLLSQSLDSAVSEIVKAIEYGESEAILTFTARAAVLIKGIAPSFVNSVLALANSFLPTSHSSGEQSKKGFEVESHYSKGPVASRSDEAAKKNNEI